MVKRVFCFSDMEFDQVQNKGVQSTDHEVITEAYKQAGYDVPQFVFWNLGVRTREDPKPVTSQIPGTVVVSGYSASMAKFFLEGKEIEEVETEKKDEKIKEKKEKEEFNPLKFMEKVLADPAFAGLKVVD